jgi:hypothetical protein
VRFSILQRGASARSILPRGEEDHCVFECGVNGRNGVVLLSVWCASLPSSRIRAWVFAGGTTASPCVMGWGHGLIVDYGVVLLLRPRPIADVVGMWFRGAHRLGARPNCLGEDKILPLVMPSHPREEHTCIIASADFERMARHLKAPWNTCVVIVAFYFPWVLSLLVS